MRFIRALKRYDGGPAVWINEEHITAMEELTEHCAKVTVAGVGEVYISADTAARLVARNDYHTSQRVLAAWGGS